MNNLCRIAFILLFCLQSEAGLLFTYNQMALKDLDQINALVRDKIKESKKSKSGQHVPLKEILQAIYCRPDDDGMIQKVIGPLKSELDEIDQYEKVMKDLVQEAINSLKNPKNFKAPVQVSYIIFLENFMAQTKPQIKGSDFVKKQFEKIAKADLSLSKEALNDRRLRLMKESRSPSTLAQEVLDEMEKSPSPESPQ